MTIVVDPYGVVRSIYTETVDLRSLGPLSIRRASHVEPDQEGKWWVDLAPVGGPKLGPFDYRTEALAAEQHWLEANWLTSSKP